MSKRQLLLDIGCSIFGLSIENLFGEAAWAKFEELHPDDDIAVVCTGPLSSLVYCAFTDFAKLVMCCNCYSLFTSSALGKKKIGRKCDVQVICLHGREFEKQKKGVLFFEGVVQGFQSGVGVGEFSGWICLKKALLMPSFQLLARADARVASMQ